MVFLSEQLRLKMLNIEDNEDQPSVTDLEVLENTMQENKTTRSWSPTEEDVMVLAEKLRGIVKKKGKGFIKFEESDGRVILTILLKGGFLIAENLDALQILHETCENLSFTEKQVCKILEILAKKEKMKFKDDVEHLNWRDTMTKRWMNLCCVVRNAERFIIPPNWVKEMLPWRQETVSEKDPREMKREDPPAEDDDLKELSPPDDP